MEPQILEQESGLVLALPELATYLQRIELRWQSGPEDEVGCQWGALLRNHSGHGWIATICTVSSGVASQHPNCGAAPPIIRSARRSSGRQAGVL
jgi:hypothetical protein